MSVDGQIVSVKLEKFVHKRQIVSVGDKICPCRVRGAKIVQWRQNCPWVQEKCVRGATVSVGGKDLVRGGGGGRFFVFLLLYGLTEV